MKLQEIYRTQIINNLKLFNVVLGLSSIGNPSIEEFLELGKKSYKQICKRKENKTKAINVLMELCSDMMVLSEDCCFYNVPILDFKAYDRPDFLLDLVLKFSSKDRIVEFINKDYKRMIAFLVVVENEVGPNIKDSLSYVVVRNFLLLCELGMFRFAYYYACLIRTQIFISEGLNPRVEYSDLFKNELSLAIKKEQNKYSKAITKKIRSGIVGTLNKVPLVNIDDSKRDKKFIGESINSTVGSDSRKSLESVNNAVDDVKQKHEEDNTHTTKELAIGLGKNIAVGTKDAVVNGSRVVGDKIVDGAKSVTKSVTEPIVNSTKEVVNNVKSNIDDKLDVNRKSGISDFVDEVNKEENHNHNDNEINESHLMDKEEFVADVDSKVDSKDESEKSESIDSKIDSKVDSNDLDKEEIEDKYDSYESEEDESSNPSKTNPSMSEPSKKKKSSRLEKLNKVKSSQDSKDYLSQKKPSRVDKLNRISKTNTKENTNKQFASSSVF